MLRKHLDQFCIAYLDDIVIYSNFIEEYREHIQLILTKVREAGLNLKLSKWVLKMQRISFIGFIVMLEGVELEPDKVCIIATLPEPTCHCDIQDFLGFASFERSFICSFLHLIKLMTDMLKGEKNSYFLGPFLPTLVMKLSFAELHNVFTKVPVLAHFHPAKRIRLETDVFRFTVTNIDSQQ
jgi:hypothetical protein